MFCLEFWMHLFADEPEYKVSKTRTDLLNLRCRTHSSQGTLLTGGTENLDGLRTGLAPLH